MNKEIKTEFQNGIESINKLITTMYPEINKTQLHLIDAEVKNIVRETIINIGNNISALTNDITI